MINIRKRGKVYQYSFEIAKVDGKRRQITKSGFATKAEAQKAGVVAYNEYMNNGKMFKSSNMSYVDYLEYWISTYANLNLKYSTIVTYYNIIKIHLKSRIGHYMLSQIDSRLLQETINKIYVDNSFSKNYIASILKVIKGSFKYAYYSLNLINENPAERVHAPRMNKIDKDQVHIFIQEGQNLDLQV